MFSKFADKRQDVILDSINEGVFTIDMRWRITAFKRAAEHITGVNSQEACSRFRRPVLYYKATSGCERSSFSPGTCRLCSRTPVRNGLFVSSEEPDGVFRGDRQLSGREFPRGLSTLDCVFFEEGLARSA